MARKRKAAIVEATAHAHAIAPIVEADQWQQHQIQCPGRQASGAMRAVPGLWLVNAEPVGDHWRTGMVMHEP